MEILARQKKTGDSNLVDPSTYDRQAQLVQISVYISPSCSSFNRGVFPIN